MWPNSGCGARLAPADADHAHGRTAHRPVDHVEVVHVLLDDVIAGEPGVVEPVAELVLHVAPPGLAGLVPEAALVPVRARGHDLADRAVLHALHRFEVRAVVTTLRAGDDRRAPFCFAMRRGREHRLVTRRVHADRLLGEDVLAGLDRGLEVHRPERRRRREDDVVRVGPITFSNASQPGELPVAGHGDLVAELLEVLEALREAIGEEIA